MNIAVYKCVVTGLLFEKFIEYSASKGYIPLMHISDLDKSTFVRADHESTVQTYYPQYQYMIPSNFIRNNDADWCMSYFGASVSYTVRSNPGLRSRYKRHLFYS